MRKTIAILAALSLAATLTGCAEQGARSSDPNAFAKETYSYSIANKNESAPREQSPALGINEEVMSAVGKTVDELSEKYGTAKEGFSDVYTFDNGLVWYNCSNNGTCRSVHGVKPADFLVGDLSTVTLDNIAEKCGFNVVPMYDDGNTDELGTMYDGYRMAYYTHPDYQNISFSMFYNENGFDETATFSAELMGELDEVLDDFIIALNSAIDSAADVEALKGNIASVDADGLATNVRVYENPNAFVANNEMSSGSLRDGMIVLVELGNECYITTRGVRSSDIMFMIGDIVRRADSIEQLASELDGYGRGGSGKVTNKVTVYENGEAVPAGTGGKTIIENGAIFGTYDDLKSGIVRIDYGSVNSWVSLSLNV